MVNIKKKSYDIEIPTLKILTSVRTTHMNIQKQIFGFKIKIVVQNMTQPNANIIFRDTSVSMTYEIHK